MEGQIKRKRLDIVDFLRGFSIIFYQVGVKWLNKFFEYTNKISYEWYLVHILVFTIYFRFARGVLPFFVDWVILMFISYLVAIGYQILVNRFIKI